MHTVDIYHVGRAQKFLDRHGNDTQPKVSCRPPSLLLYRQQEAFSIETAFPAAEQEKRFPFDNDQQRRRFRFQLIDLIWTR
jgi:hypothetical protein